MEWSRQREADLVSHCVQVARCDIAPASRDDADVCRLSAQLVRTRYPEASRNLTAAADAYFFLGRHIRLIGHFFSPGRSNRILHEGALRCPDAQPAAKPTASIGS